MESLKRAWGNLPLRRFFLLSVLFTVAVVAALSGVVIWGCLYFRHWLLPDANAVYLTVEQVFADGHTTEGEYLLGFGDDLESLPELVVMDGEDPVEQNVDRTKYAVQKVENSYSMLTPKRKAAYRLCGVVMVAAPAFFAFAGILVCSAYFYRRKLKQPLELLGYAAKQIAGQDLDFEVAYDCGDEMGALCRSFEHMRRELCENHKAMWKMLEERRLLQASVAHDLRNPIAIIEGYAEYMEAGLKAGKLNREKLAHVTSNLHGAARRLEQYTESVRQLNQSEEEALERRAIPATELAEGLAEDLNLLAEKKGVTLKIKGELPGEEIQADVALIHRVLENIMNNALRYARREICLDFALADHSLSVTVTDDGEGFSPEMLRQGERKLLAAGEDGHMGIGISASRLLCRKHGGSLALSNVSGGACVKIVFSV